MHARIFMLILFALTALLSNIAYGETIQEHAAKEAKVKKESLKVVTKKETSTKIDLNNATKEELMEIKGIGAKLAEGLIKGRPYTSWDDVSKVKGIGDAKLKAIKEKAAI